MPNLLQTLARDPRIGVSVAPEPDGWSILQILVHVRASDAVLGNRILSLAAGCAGIYPSVDERRLGALLGRSGLSLDDQVALFTLRRTELLELLRSLTAPEWLQSGTHEIHGSISVLGVCEALADHEREHAAQIAEIVNAQRQSVRVNQQPRA